VAADTGSADILFATVAKATR